MKLQNKTTRSVKRISALAAFGLLILFGLTHNTLAQAQWETNGNNINSTNTGNVGVGTTNPINKLDVNGNINTSGGLCIQGDCKGAWSQVGGQWINGLGGAISYLGGNVGIGTNSGTLKLGVQGMFGVYSQAFVAPNQRGLFMFHGGTVGSIYSFNYPSGTADPISISASNLDFNTYIGSTPNTRLSIANGGNVGIGTTSPNAVLDLASSTQLSNRIRFSGQEYYQAGNTSTHGIDIRLGANRTGERQLWFADSASAINATTPQLRMRFTGTYATLDSISTDGTVTLPLAINATGGNVGIGTATPGYKLDVNGDINATGLRINGTPIATGGSQWTTSAPNIYFNTGNVGIGTNGPVEVVHVRKDQNAPTHLLVENGTAGALSYADLKVKNNVGQFAQFGLYSSTTTTAGAIASGNAFTYTTSPAMVIAADNPGGVIKFATGGLTERARVDAGGNFGIGTSVPGSKLDVVGTIRGGNADTNIGNHPNHTPSYSGFWRQGADYSLLTDGTNTFLNAPVSTGNIYFRSANADKIFLQGSTGNVGIGTTAPSTKLHVAGSITVDGNIAAKYQDVAEWVESSQSLPAGTVVVLDHTKSNQVVASTEAYDTRVAGVISAQPGITLGESGDAKVLVATTGRVRIKVDATTAPIQVGDLLVTGEREGYAMKSLPVNIGGVQLHRPGTLVGKALEPLAKGTGEILVLLSLQ